jgi:hypothetical protein
MSGKRFEIPEHFWPIARRSSIDSSDVGLAPTPGGLKGRR